MLYSSDRSPQRPDLKIKVAEELKQFSLNTYRSVFLVHWIGYGLLLFWLIDTCFLIFPFRFTDPNWLIVMFEGFVQSSPVLLVGFVLSFFGERKPRLDWEFLTLKVLSWWTGILSILFILLIPCTILIGYQVTQINQTTVGRTTQTQISQLQILKQNVTNARSSAELQLASNLIGLNESSNSGGNSSNPGQVRDVILRRLRIEENALKQKGESQLTAQNLSTLKRSVKICLGAVMSSILFFLIWRSTGWAR
jgi:hypothetical protein